jgi:hypothetical protein
MRAFLVLLLLCLVALVIYNQQTSTHVRLPNRAQETSTPPKPRESAITPDGSIVRVVSVLAGELYNHDFILEFEPGGRPFQTTWASKEANRKRRVAIINALKVAATHQDKQIAADINLVQVAWDAGGAKDRDDAISKLFDDLRKIKVTGKEAISYDPASPWGQIIADLEERLAYDDKSEAEYRAKEDALSKAKRAAGAK